jgi:hypothetical protein
MTDYSDDNVTVCIPVIPPRVGNLLDRAVASVNAQTKPPAGGISCALDVNHAGAAITRQRALDGVRTGWVAFLDDDDTWYPHHLETLLHLAHERSADFVYSWFDGNNPFPMHRGRQMNLDEPHHTTMTVMVRTELAHAVGFGDGSTPEGWREPWEDWKFITGCVELGRQGRCVFAGTAEITWTYHVHGGNTSGLATRW